MSDDRIDLNIIRDRFYGLLIENRSLVRPVIGNVFYMIPDILLHPLAAIYAGGPADAQDMMLIGRDDAVIRYGVPSCVMDSFLVEISGIVMITVQPYWMHSLKTSVLKSPCMSPQTMICFASGYSNSIIIFAKVIFYHYFCKKECDMNQIYFEAKGEPLPTSRQAKCTCFMLSPSTTQPAKH